MFLNNNELDISLNFNKLSRQLKQNTCNLLARLRSIHEDSLFIKEIFQQFPNYPTFANLRCGLWYYPSFHSTCYFKSTDGHVYHWHFSFSRLNLHVLKQALFSKKCLIVDSTRKGKIFPDSFLKTIPIWCCVFNRVLEYLKFKDLNKDLNGQLNNKLILNLNFVSENEKSQIENKIDEWVNEVLKSVKNGELNLNEFIELFDNKPLQCIYISKRTDLSTLQNINYTNIENDFIPIILVSASDPDHLIKNKSWEYIQGAGDDHESWSLGLTPFLFWNNLNDLINCQTNEECEYLVKQLILKQSKNGKNDKMIQLNSIASLHCKNNNLNNNMIVKDSINVDNNKLNEELNILLNAIEIGKTNLFVGVYNNFSTFEELNNLFNDKNIFICCSEEENILQYSNGQVFPLIENKKKKRNFEDYLGIVLEYVKINLLKSKNIYILGKFGKNEEIILVIAILCSFYNLENVFVGEFKDRLDKQIIRKKLLFIQSFIYDVAPSRNLLKNLNRYFLS